MNIQQEILRAHSKDHALKIAGYACSSGKVFRELIRCLLDDDQQLARRAAWTVSWSARIKPDIVIPHIKDLVAVLRKKYVHEAVVRNTVRILQEIEIPVKFQGEVMDSCFQFLENPSTPVAIKVHSLTTLYNFSKSYPDIKPELKLIIQELWEHETAAFRSRAKKVLKELEK